MGSLMSKQFATAAQNVSQIIKGRKRKYDEDDSESSQDEHSLDTTLNTPKRKKLLSTTQYIYQALYKESRSSDISVRALGKTFELHKIYLCQSPYFSSMFSGNWRESDDDFVAIEITDPNITIKSLDIVFGSLYQDEVVLEPLEIVGILATAAVFQLEGLIEKCAEVMCETTNSETAVNYYETACSYGVHSVKKVAFEWLLTNFMGFYSKSSKRLSGIDVDLMTALASSPNLCVMQTEFSLYIILRSWMFLKLFPEYTPPEKTDGSKEVVPNQQPDHSTYFAKRESDVPFLNTREGKQFEKAFRALRLRNLLNHYVDIRVLKQDKIIPIQWLYEPVFEQWVYMLHIDHSLDKGPTKDVDESIFYETCMRCGRILQEEDFQKWRWTGFNFGLDLVLIIDARTLSIKRHHRTENERLLSLQVKRQFLIKITLISLNDQRQIKHSQTTDIKSLSLDKNEEVHLLHMDTELTYPLLISANILVVTPPQTPKTDSNTTTQASREILPQPGRSTPTVKQS
ncbi:protein germ cell-less [Culicoides brevitarsis]|uniref:protein germ cell-less n=1 Tax=Culicoides brevitarsis TaxID=469753 RepID=UPI00307B2148